MKKTASIDSKSRKRRRRKKYSGGNRAHDPKSFSVFLTTEQVIRARTKHMARKGQIEGLRQTLFR